ncbi:unnamed protein product [marine sediment metagenome]|uniref:Uncharacterized protein n=1 Tax=marine sediment metagenome TaxID=412755 RepID=X1HJP0_9ZZZZ
MNVNSFIIKDYRKNDDFAVQKNKPNSNPISEKPKMNVNLYVIKEYENEPLSGSNKMHKRDKKTAKKVLYKHVNSWIPGYWVPA